MEDELLPCRVCFEDCGYIEDEGGWCVYAICGNCGSATAFIQYDSDNEKLDAIKRASQLWNMGKVIAERRSE